MRLIDFKSYVEPVSTGAILGAAGISAGGQVASGLFKPSLKRQWKYQQKQMKLQQQYALEQMQKQGEINYANWQKQFDYENAYNDPTKVFDRYLKAGVTPAAVLGSSGVGVNATMSGGSSGSVGASGPSGGSFDFSSPLPPGVGSAAAGAALEAMGVNSTIERNKAAANLDNAQADDIRNRMPTREQGQALIELEKQLKRANIGSQSSLARYYGELAINQAAYNKYVDLAATYDFQRIQAAYAEQVERTRRIHAENDAEIPLLEQSAAANLAYLCAAVDAASASARESRSRADILDIQQKDMQHMFEVTWETPVKVPLVNEKGEPTGEFEEITGREFYSYLRGLDLGEGRQRLSGNWFTIRKDKNALFYDVTKAFATAAGIAGASYVGRKAAGPAGPEGYEEVREIYDPSGTQTSSTYTRRNYHERN